MATKTASVSGNWSAGATWGGSAPSDGDTVGCNADVTVTLDQDLSGATTGFIFSGWNGTLSPSRTAGTYGIKIKTSTSWAGTGKIDTGADYPTDCQFNITHAASAKIALTGANLLDCARPANPYVFTKAEYVATTTKIYVVDADGNDVDVTADAEWKNGYYVRVDNDATTPASEEFTISNTGSDGGGYYVTLSAGLAATKVIGSIVTLCSRNIQHNGATSGSGGSYEGASNSTIRCAIRGFAYATNNIYSCDLNVVISGCTYGFYSAFNNRCEGLYLSGNTLSLMNCSGVIVEDLSISGATRGLYKSGAIEILSGVFTGNTYHTHNVSGLVARNCVWNNGTKWYNCTATYINPSTYLESINDENVEGAYDARTAGGTASRATGSGDYTITCEDAANWAFKQTRFTLMPGEVRRVQCAMSRASGGPSAKIDIIQVDTDPLVDSTFTPRATQAMVSDDETLDIDWANPFTYPVEVYVRVSALAASGTVDFSEIITSQATICPHDVYVECIATEIEDATLSPDNVYILCVATDNVSSEIAISPDSVYIECICDNVDQVLSPDGVYVECIASEIEHTTLEPDSVYVECIASDSVAIDIPLAPDSAYVACAPTDAICSHILTPDSVYVACVCGSGDTVLSPDNVYIECVADAIPIVLAPNSVYVETIVAPPIPFLQPDNVYCLTYAEPDVKSDLLLSPSSAFCATIAGSPS